MKLFGILLASIAPIICCPFVSAEEKGGDQAQRKAEAPDARQPAGKADAAAEEKPAFEPYEGEIIASRVNIRSGPSTNYRSLLRAKKGFGVIVTGQEGDWLRIAVPLECLLWIHKDYVKVSEDGKSGRVTGDRVNVRIAPEAEADIVGQVVEGDELEVTGAEGDWLEIAAPPTASAWVHKDYVKRVGQQQQ